MDSNYYKRCVISLPIGITQLLYVILILLNNSNEIEIYRELSFFQTFYNFFANTQTVLSLYYSMIFIVIQIFCFGTYIYSDLQVSSVYYFSRNVNKNKWFVSKILHLNLFIFIFCTIYILFFLFVIRQLTGFSQLSVLMPFAAKQIILSMSYALFLCILTNILAIIIGSVKAITLVNIIHIFIVLFLFSVHQENSSFEFAILYIDKLEMNQYIFLVGFIFGISFITEFVGAILIKKYDIGLSSIESEL